MTQEDYDEDDWCDYCEKPSDECTCEDSQEAA